VLSSVEVTSKTPGQLALVWVAVNFAVFALARKLKKNVAASSEPKEVKTQDPPR
jgi:hypothetical protein